MLPMVVGIFTTSITAGQLMSRNGRYKIFPILGAAHRDRRAGHAVAARPRRSPYWFAGLSMFVLGAGLGFTMQVLIIVVQNSVDRTDMGVATSSVAFFRQMGGSFGTALFGAILSSRLAVHIADALPGRAGRLRSRRTSATSATTCRRSRRCRSRCTALVTGAFSDSLHDMFLSARAARGGGAGGRRSSSRRCRWRPATARRRRPRPSSPRSSSRTDVPSHRESPDPVRGPGSRRPEHLEVADRQLLGVAFGLPGVREVLHHGVERRRPAGRRPGRRRCRRPARPCAIATITPSGCTETSRPEQERLQHVRLELLHGDHAAEHDQRDDRALGDERDEHRHRAGQQRADHRDEAHR